MRNNVFLCGLGCCLLFALAAGTAGAQQPGNPVFELRKFHVNQPSSPDHNGEKSFSYTASKENWLQLVCEYRVVDPDGWLDNVTFKWHVHLIGAETERLIFTKSITYDKIEASGKAPERAVVYLSPRDIKRYYSSRNAAIASSKVVCYVEILVDGVSVGEFNYPDRLPSGVPPQWWNNRQVARIDNALLSRTESPWALMDVDTWPPERPSDKPVAK